MTIRNSDMINDKNIIISKDWSLINSYELPYDDNLFFYRAVSYTHLDVYKRQL